MKPTLYSLLRPFWPGGETLQSLKKELAQTQWLSAEALEAWQFERIRRLVAYAYENVPYYNELYCSLDIHPEDIKSIGDFQKLPFVTREEINTHLREMTAWKTHGKLLADSTGGSTGEPLHFYREKAFDWWDPALELRGRGWYGVGEGEKMALVWGAKRDMHLQTWRERFKAILLQERVLNAFNMTDATMAEFAGMLVKWKPAMFRAYASALALFAQYVKDHQINGIRPRIIETTAEKVTQPQRELIEEVFQCKVADWYSARELGTIAYQCPEGSLHVCETRYLEVVANDRPVKAGELGEVAITSLHQYGMPFIRYKIGDMAIADDGPCTCGRGLPRLKEVVGRLQDFLVTSEGQFVHGGYFPHTLRHWPQILRYQVYQPDRKHLEVRLMCKTSDDLAWISNLRNELRECFGVQMNISLNIVDEIPLTSAGKHRPIISEVKPDFV